MSTAAYSPDEEGKKSHCFCSLWEFVLTRMQSERMDGYKSFLFSFFSLENVCCLSEKSIFPSAALAESTPTPPCCPSMHQEGSTKPSSNLRKSFSLCTAMFLSVLSSADSHRHPCCLNSSCRRSVSHHGKGLSGPQAETETCWILVIHTVCAGLFSMTIFWINDQPC